jgi:arylsulfatase
VITPTLPAFDDDVWELYAADDWTQARDLAAEMPEKLHELQRLFLLEAAKHNVLPLDDRRVERFNADLVGRPQLIRGHSQLLFGGMGLTENSVVNIKKSHAVTARSPFRTAGDGVIIAQAAPRQLDALREGGRRPPTLRLRRFKIAGDARPSGERQIGWSSPTTAAGWPGGAGHALRGRPEG